MAVFLFWTGLLLSGVCIYLFWLWRRYKNTPFRIKLTILFLSFVLLPAIPLLFMNAQLLTQSARVLLMPGYENALTQSLQSLRTLSEEKGRLFLKTYPDPELWTKKDIQAFDLEFAVWKNVGDENQQLRLILADESMDHTFILESFLNTQRQTTTSKLIQQGTTFYIMVMVHLSDSRECAVGYPLSSHIINSREQIEKSLQIYSTVILLKNVILQKELVWSLAVLLLAAFVLISIQIAKSVSRAVHEPIQAMVSEMDKVKQGNLDVEIQSGAKGEFRFLIDEFNQMIRDLKESREKLIASEKLAAWRDVARRMSHEIKNTLGPMMLSLRQLRANCDEIQSEKVESHLSILESEFQGMKTMAENFSAFAKMPKPQLAPVQLNASIQHVVEYLSPMHPDIEFQLTLDDGLQTVQADHQQINRVLANLIKNAIDASAGKGNIRIITENLDESKQVHCKIVDNGCGISKENLDKIMSPYFTTKAKGTGLGLSIVKQIIEEHGGILNIESDGEKGTTVSFFL